MTSAQSRTRSTRLVITAGAIALLTGAAAPAWAQAPPDLFSKVDTLTLSDGTPAVGPFSLAGDTAVVGSDGVAHVFEREPGGNHWVRSATLAPSDGGSGLPWNVATDGKTTVVGGVSAGGVRTVYVFQRVPDSPAWQEVARLSGDVNANSFGASVAVRGTTVVVGAPSRPPASPDDFGAGLVYVFEQDLGGPGAWGESARLMGAADPGPGRYDAFGGIVAIDRDTLLVSATTPFAPGSPIGASTLAYVFSRHQDEPNAWDRVATLGLGGGEIPPAPAVSISADTVVGGAGQPPLSVARAHISIFQRDSGGPNAWGQVAFWFPASFHTLTISTSISGDLLVTGDGDFQPGVFSAFARHQGGANVWGEVQRIGAAHFPSVAISGDTVLLNDRSELTGERTPIDVYVADTDRDGLRDGADPCPRDPLNNVAGDCQRASTVHPVLDELIAQGDVTSETRKRRQIVTATFTNTSDTAIQNPFFEVTTLTGGNVLLNADEGRGRIGATLSPDVGDGVLSPGESMTATFRIRLRTPDPFQFFVTFHGDVMP